MKLSTTKFSIILQILIFINLTVTSPINIVPRGSSNGVIIGYFPNWLYGNYPPSQINFRSYTHIYYAFALQVSGNIPSWAYNGVLDDYVQYGLPNLMKLADAAGTKVTVSVGGWSGGTAFSSMASSSSSRAEFIQWNVNFITKYGTAGVDIDWEYPGSTGAGCNTRSSDDVNNLLSLVGELRNALDLAFPNDHKEITLAVHVTPWGPDIQSTDVSAFVPFVDRFHVMTFDINGAWNSTSGPNAPFNTEPGLGYSVGFVSAVETWHSAGVPYNKIAAGIPFYGRSQTLTVSSIPSTQYNPAVSPNAPLGDSYDGPWQDSYCSSDSTQASGVWRYKNLRSQGLLTSPTTAASPWIRNFDSITQTPWLYNPTTKDFISYDDPVSVGIKTQWAISKGLAGLFCWSVDEDNGELLNVMQSMLNFNGGGQNSGTSTTTTIMVSSSSISLATSLITPTYSNQASPTSSGTLTPSSSTTTSLNTSTCSGVSTYSSTISYVGGNQVVYNNRLYKANWWNLNQAPSQEQYGPWSLINAC
ncbi:carbohydrate-binding module family 5 protein [Backusella circina FSU 941]|nr:carbohydrate-binding module family 5 protein [Backusella circina FSU 941]